MTIEWVSPRPWVGLTTHRNCHVDKIHISLILEIKNAIWEIKRDKFWKSKVSFEKSNETNFGNQKCHLRNQRRQLLEIKSVIWEIKRDKFRKSKLPFDKSNATNFGNQKCHLRNQTTSFWKSNIYWKNQTRKFWLILIFYLWLKRKIFLVLVFHFDFPANIWFPKLVVFDFSTAFLISKISAFDSNPKTPFISRQLTTNKAFKRGSPFCSLTRLNLQNEDPIHFASVDNQQSIYARVFVL